MSNQADSDQDPSVPSLDHYETLLGEVYDWMQGGWDARVQQSRELFASLGISPSAPGAQAVDLGAGTGYQSIPLAELGFAVTAIDASATMLDTLTSHIDDAKTDGTVRTVEGDLRHFGDEVTGPVELVTCMGDTLTHLKSHRDVTEFIASAYEIQSAGGRIMLGFRDGSQPLEGNSRFIPVRSDHDRVFTCFIEEVDDATVRVHDVLHLRGDDGFVQNVSSYNKIRLSTDWVSQQLSDAGYKMPEASVTAGMTIMLATK